MSRLARDTINQLAEQFCSNDSLLKKQDAVDQLGCHPVNHAEFIDAINGFLQLPFSHTRGDISLYLDCVQWMNEASFPADLPA